MGIQNKDPSSANKNSFYLQCSQKPWILHPVGAGRAKIKGGSITHSQQPRYCLLPRLPLDAWLTGPAPVKGPQFPFPLLPDLPPRPELSWHTRKA